MPRHSDLEYEAELEQLRAGLRELGERMEDALAAALKATTGTRVKKAGSLRVAISDGRRIAKSIDRLCLRILALRQPTASDLRFVVSALKANLLLERVGRLALRLADRGKVKGQHASNAVVQLAEQVYGAFDEARQALAEESSQRVTRVRSAQRKVATLRGEVMRDDLGGNAIVLDTLGDVSEVAEDLAELVPFLLGGGHAQH